MIIEEDGSVRLGPHRPRLFQIGTVTRKGKILHIAGWGIDANPEIPDTSGSFPIFSPGYTDEELAYVSQRIRAASQRIYSPSWWRRLQIWWWLWKIRKRW